MKEKQIFFTNFNGIGDSVGGENSNHDNYAPRPAMNDWDL